MGRRVHNAGALRSGGVGSVSPTGVLGDPTAATAAEGHQVLARLVADLCDCVDRMFSGVA